MLQLFPIYIEHFTDQVKLEKALGTTFQVKNFQLSVSIKHFTVIRFNKTFYSYPFDGSGFILAHAYYPYEFGSFGGDIHFDEDEDWRPDAAQSEEGLDFFTVAVSYCLCRK
jgi:hypothetical protein